MTDLDEALDLFVCDACEALRLFCQHFHVEPNQVLNLGRERRVGCAKLSDGRRLLWRFHGSGIYLRLSHRKAVDFDFAYPSTAPGGRLMSDGWKLARMKRVNEWTPEGISSSSYGDAKRPGFFTFSFS